ncbi:MAG: type II secretion system protein GspK [Pseudomonadota bacterium]
MDTNKQQGFILATTVWMIAILSILAAVFHGYVQDQVASARAIKLRVQADLDMNATAVTVRYLLGTRRATLAGLTVLPEHQLNVITDEGVADISPVGFEIKLDGSLYAGIGNAWFQIQDQAGLLGLNSPGVETFFFEVLRDRVSSQTARELSGALADYIDGNTKRRFNGAERPQYQAASLPGPSNWFLRTDQELADVLGWGERLMDTGFASLVAPTYANVLNVNTAPPPLLGLLLNLDEDQVQKLVSARNDYPFRSLESVADAVNAFANWEENRFRFYSSDQLRVTLGCNGCNFVRIESVELTPDGYFGPLLTDYVYLRPRSREQTDNVQAAASVAGDLFKDTLPAKG